LGWKHMYLDDEAAIGIYSSLFGGWHVWARLGNRLLRY